MCGKKCVCDAVWSRTTTRDRCWNGGVQHEVQRRVRRIKIVNTGRWWSSQQHHTPTRQCCVADGGRMLRVCGCVVSTFKIVNISLSRHLHATSPSCAGDFSTPRPHTFFFKHSRQHGRMGQQSMQNGAKKGVVLCHRMSGKGSNQRAPLVCCCASIHFTAGTTLSLTHGNDGAHGAMTPVATPERFCVNTIEHPRGLGEDRRRPTRRGTQRTTNRVEVA